MKGAFGVVFFGSVQNAVVFHTQIVGHPTSKVMRISFSQVHNAEDKTEKRTLIEVL